MTNEITNNTAENINCIDCENCTGCTNCVGCRNCTGCFQCSDCDFCTDCEHCAACMNCTGCDHKTAAHGLKNNYPTRIMDAIMEDVWRLVDAQNDIEDAALTDPDRRKNTMIGRWYDAAVECGKLTEGDSEALKDAVLTLWTDEMPENIYSHAVDLYEAMKEQDLLARHREITEAFYREADAADLFEVRPDATVWPSKGATEIIRAFVACKRCE